jgi:hypothetical protein
MRALLTSDLQLRNFNEFSSITEGGYNSRLLALLYGLTAILQREQPELDGRHSSRPTVLAVERPSPAKASAGPVDKKSRAALR